MCSPAVCGQCRKVTYSGCGQHVAQVMANVPPARLFDEIQKLLLSGHAVETVKSLRAHGLAHGLLPLLDVILEQPLGQRFIELALAEKMVGSQGRSRVFLWLVPANARGRWIADLPELEAELSTAIARLQAGESGFDLGAGAVQFSGIPTGMQNVLRDLQESALGSRVNQLESMTIELVAMLFDFIFETKDLPDGIKALLARLQIPVLKAAMLDGAFFANGLPVFSETTELIVTQARGKAVARLTAEGTKKRKPLPSFSTSQEISSYFAAPTFHRPERLYPLWSIFYGVYYM